MLAIEIPLKVGRHLEPIFFSFLGNMEPSSSTEVTSGRHQQQPLSNDQQVRVLPKWHIVTASRTPASSIAAQRGSLKPGSAPQKATLLTKNGPQDVSF